MHRFQHFTSIILIFLALSAPTSPLAESELDKASVAVTGILFEHGADEFTTYIIKEDGSVDITFARNTPDAVYGEILNKLQSHPDIKGVLAGKGGPSCALF